MSRPVVTQKNKGRNVEMFRDSVIMSDKLCTDMMY